LELENKKKKFGKSIIKNVASVMCVMCRQRLEAMLFYILLVGVIALELSISSERGGFEVGYMNLKELFGGGENLLGYMEVSFYVYFTLIPISLFMFNVFKVMVGKTTVQDILLRYHVLIAMFLNFIWFHIFFDGEKIMQDFVMQMWGLSLACVILRSIGKHLWHCDFVTGATYHVRKGIGKAEETHTNL